MTRHFALAAALSLLATLPRPVLAQSADVRAAAEVLFNDGRRLMDAGDYAAACAKLEQSQQVDASVGTLGWLGRCYEKQGKTASAWATYRSAITLAQQRGDNQRRKLAEERAAALEGKLSHLSIDVATVAHIVGLTVRRDGVTLQSSVWSQPFPVDPGEHVIEASAEGYETSTLRVQVGPNGAREVAVLKGLMPKPAPASEAAPPVTAAPPPASAAPPPEKEPAPAVETPAEPTTVRAVAPGPVRHDESPRRRTRGTPALAVAGYISTAAGVVGLGVGAYFVIQRSTKLTARDSACPSVPGGDCPSEVKRIEYEARQEEAKDAAALATPTLLVGGALVATGFTLLLISSSSRDAEGAALSVAPLASHEGGGVWMRGRW